MEARAGRPGSRWLHREHEGVLKQVRIIRLGDGNWYADFICTEVPAKPMPKVDAEVGIDLGISAFAALSDGTLIAAHAAARS